jgi:hypothetical protein
MFQVNENLDLIFGPEEATRRREAYKAAEALGKASEPEGH